MNLVDSSGWIEYFRDGANADFFAPSIEDADNLIVSSINIYEVFKKFLHEKNENDALKAVSAMRRARVIPVDDRIALEGARLSREMGLPMADCLILTTARLHGAVLWTQDADFKSIEGVRYIRK